MSHKKTSRRTVYFKPPFYYETTADFCYHLGINPGDIAVLTGCSTKTARRWIAAHTPPRWLLPFLLAASGYVLTPGFDGWRCSDGILTAPGLRYGLTVSQVESYTWHLDALHVAWSHLNQLEKPHHEETCTVIDITNRLLKQRR